jgi:hypothetical protein
VFVPNPDAAPADPLLGRLFTLVAVPFHAKKLKIHPTNYLFFPLGELCYSNSPSLPAPCHLCRAYQPQTTPTMLSPSRLPFVIHAAIETAAAFTFILKPASHLTPLSPAAGLLLQSKGGLLLFTNLICVIFLSRPVDETTRSVALAFAFWHLWPCYRAAVRLQYMADTEEPRPLGGPVVHLGVHLGLLLLFLVAGFSSS